VTGEQGGELHLDEDGLDTVGGANLTDGKQVLGTRGVGGEAGRHAPASAYLRGEKIEVVPEPMLSAAEREHVGAVVDEYRWVGYERRSNSGYWL
jgi:hypothetical protein